MPTNLPAASGSGVFFNNSTARIILTDLKYYKENYPKIIEKGSILEAQVLNLNKQVSAATDLLNGCNTDKKDLIKVSGDFEKKYIDTNNELVKCRDATPSRYLWFSYGLISASVLGLLGALLVAR